MFHVLGTKIGATTLVEACLMTNLIIWIGWAIRPDRCKINKLGGIENIYITTLITTSTGPGRHSLTDRTCLRILITIHVITRHRIVAS